MKNRTSISIGFIAAGNETSDFLHFVKYFSAKFTFCSSLPLSLMVLTQDEVAKKTETTRSTVAQWENGLIVPTLAQLEKICRALECKSIDILGF